MYTQAQAHAHAQAHSHTHAPTHITFYLHTHVHVYNIDKYTYIHGTYKGTYIYICSPPAPAAPP
jgi:hypothetical protein